MSSRSIPGAPSDRPARVRWTVPPDNAVLHGTIEDVLLRLKPGAKVPAKPAKRLDVGEVARLRAELDAMRRSTCWRVTAPLRAVGRRLCGSA